MGWRYHTEVGADRTLHVWPESDAREHITEALRACWCEPCVQEHGRGVVVMHNDRLDRWYDAELSRPIAAILGNQICENDGSGVRG